MQRFLQFTRDDSGSTLIEYALLVALISLVVFASLKTIGLDLSVTFTSVGDELKTHPG